MVRISTMINWTSGGKLFQRKILDVEETYSLQWRFGLVNGVLPISELHQSKLASVYL